MRKLLPCLMAVTVTGLLLSGCEAVKAEVKSPAAPPASAVVESADPTYFETDDYSDQEALGRLASIIDYSAEQAKPVRREFTALVKSISVNGSNFTLSLDRIELTDNTNPKDDFYTNADEKVESVELPDYVVILVDPHNHFKAITAQGLEELLEDGDIPFHFYSVGSEISMMIEMMLP